MLSHSLTLIENKATGKRGLIALAGAGILFMAVAGALRIIEAPYIAVAEDRFRDAKPDLLHKASAGNGFASLLLGRGYELGKFGPADNVEAGQWYTKAAQQNEHHAIARYVNIAVATSTESQDKCQRFIKLLDLAGRARDPFALRLLGNYYATGICVVRDHVTAVRYYMGAAKIDGMLVGSGTAEAALSLFYSSELRNLPALPERFDIPSAIALQHFFAELPAISAK